MESPLSVSKTLKQLHFLESYTKTFMLRKHRGQMDPCVSSYIINFLAMKLNVRFK